MKSGSVLRASVILVVAVVAAMISAPAQAAQLPNSPTLPIEQKYYAPGPWVVTTAKAVGCGSSGAKCDLWYPTKLGQNGFRHPIITWGNGSDAVPSQYSSLLSHLASWGFVVVASENVNTGTGQEILDAARWMAGQNDQASSIFSHVLVPTRVGAMGHSQGASGALNAMIKSGGLIMTVVPIELPAQIYCLSTPARCTDTRNLRGGAIFLVNGSADVLVSPSTQNQPWQQSGLQSNSAYYEAAPASVTKVWGTLKGPDHNDVQGQPSCASANPTVNPPWSCVNGVYGYLGYPTAWMMDRLQGDGYAHQAFIRGTGEMAHETTNWRNQVSNISN